MYRLPGIKHLLQVISHYNSTFDTQSPVYKWWLLANVMIGTFMAVLDATIVNVGLPKIMASFGVGVDKIEWVLTGYMLSMAVMLPTSGWLADRFGYKRVYFLGLFFFTLGSFLCGISSTENMLIASRVIQGLGAGCLMPVGMAIITREFPVEKRGLALGFWSIASAASVSLGPLIGGYLVDNFNWQLIFDVNVPVGIAGMFATAIIQKEYLNKRIRSFDVVGFLSVTIFLPLLLYALTEGNASTNSGGWHSPQIYICLTISALAFIVFIVNELVIKEPLIELRLLKDHNFGITSIVTFIFGVGMFGSTFLIPLYLQTSLGYTAIQAGMVFLPLGLIQGIAAPVSGLIADRVNGKLIILAGGMLLAFSFWLNSRMSVFTEHSYIMLSLYLRGLAMGMMFSPLAALGLVTVPREKMAQASGLNNVIRQVGGSFGVALFSTMLTSRVIYHIQIFGQSIDPNSPAFTTMMQNMERFAGTAGGLVGPQATAAGKSILFTHISKQAFVDGINDNFLIACLFTLLCMVPVFFLKNKKKAVAKSKNMSPTSHK
jgi:DHA2 family multidrug resistance protein